MAADYLRQIRSVQPRGPYFLGGFSFGGLVAFEMAQQLRQSGQQLALLVLIDPTPPRCSDVGAREVPSTGSGFGYRSALGRYWRNLKHLDPNRWASYLSAGLKWRSEYLVRALKMQVCCAYLQFGGQLPSRLRRKKWPPAVGCSRSLRLRGCCPTRPSIGKLSCINSPVSSSTSAHSVGKAASSGSKCLAQFLLPTVRLLPNPWLPLRLPTLLDASCPDLLKTEDRYVSIWLRKLLYRRPYPPRAGSIELPSARQPAVHTHRRFPTPGFAASPSFNPHRLSHAV